MQPLTAEQEAAVEANAGYPNYIFRIELDEAKFWSTNAETTDGSSITYTPGYIKFGSKTNDELRFSFWNQDYIHTENCVSGAYLRNPVEVYWHYTPSVAPPYWESGYAEEGYVDGGGDSTQPNEIEIFSGFIYSTPRIGDWIEVIARPSPPKFYPNTIIRKPIANFLPPPGYSVEFDGAILQIED